MSDRNKTHAAGLSFMMLPYLIELILGLLSIAAIMSLLANSACNSETCSFPLKLHGPAPVGGSGRN